MSEAMEPGTMFIPAPGSILAENITTHMAMAGKLGSDDEMIPVMTFTFEGRVNQTDQRQDATVILSVRDAFEFATQVFETIADAMGGGTSAE